MPNLLFASIFSTFLMATLAQQAAAQRADTSQQPYPATRRASQTDTYHGVTVPDPYRWLEDANSPETRQWVEAQNAFTFGYLNRMPVRDSIRTRLTKIWDYPKYGSPVRARNRYFYLENSGLQNQAVLYVKDGINGRPTVLLDPNTMSAAGMISLSFFEPSPSSNFVAYGVSESGSDWTEIRIRDVRRGIDLADTLKWVKFSEVSWTRDNKGFLYSRYDAPKSGEELTGVVLNQKLFFHRVGTPQSADELILERPDAPDLGFSAEVSHDGEFVVITGWRGTDTRNLVYIIDLAGRGADRISAPVVRVVDSFIGSFRFIHGDSTRLYFQTDYQAPKGRVIRINVDRASEQYWTNIIEEGSNTMRDVVSAGEDFIVHYLKDARSVLSVYSRFGELAQTIELPGLGTVAEISGSPEHLDLFFSYTSYLSPPAVFHYDLRVSRLREYRTPHLDFPFDQYETSQIFATNKDGTKVPIFVTAKKGIKLDGSNHAIIYGYGGFDISLTPDFSPALLAWLERGGVYASVNTRGGGEYGRPWHEAGTLLRKQNVFDDFVAAAEHLIKAGYTSSSRLAMMGGSNGGLLVGAVMAQRPDIAAVALPAVGVMDMLRFQKFTIGWAWTSDYGSSDDAEQFRALYAYSPLHNLRAGTRYPATLITTADHDDRVVPAHSYKFAAALQAAQSGTSPTLIRIDTESGHGAGKPTAKRIEEWVDRLAFAWTYTRGGAP